MATPQDKAPREDNSSVDTLVDNDARADADEGEDVLNSYDDVLDEMYGADEWYNSNNSNSSCSNGGGNVGGVSSSNNNSGSNVKHKLESVITKGASLPKHIQLGESDTIIATTTTTNTVSISNSGNSSSSSSSSSNNNNFPSGGSVPPALPLPSFRDFGTKTTSSSLGVPLSTPAVYSTMTRNSTILSNQQGTSSLAVPLRPSLSTSFSGSTRPPATAAAATAATHTPPKPTVHLVTHISGPAPPPLKRDDTSTTSSSSSTTQEGASQNKRPRPNPRPIARSNVRLPLPGELAMINAQKLLMAGVTDPTMLMAPPTMASVAGSVMTGAGLLPTPVHTMSPYMVPMPANQAGLLAAPFVQMPSVQPGTIPAGIFSAQAPLAVASAPLISHTFYPPVPIPAMGGYYGMAPLFSSPVAPAVPMGYDIAQANAAMAAQTSAASPTRVVIGGLPVGVNETMLRHHLRMDSDVINVEFFEQNTKAFLQFRTDEAARRCRRQFHKTTWSGQTVMIEFV